MQYKMINGLEDEFKIEPVKHNNCKRRQWFDVGWSVYDDLSSERATHDYWCSIPLNHFEQWGADWRWQADKYRMKDVLNNCRGGATSKLYAIKHNLR